MDPKGASTRAQAMLPRARPIDSPDPKDQMTVAEFLTFTESRPNAERWELIEGRPTLQASPSKPHQLIVANIGGLLWTQKRSLRASWLPLPGVGTLVPASPNSLPQPDFMVLEHALADDDFSNVTDDALVLFEVISRSNTKRDQSWRRRVYASIANCRHYVTVHQRRCEVVCYHRAAGWEGTKITALDATLALPALGAVLPLADVYADTPVAKRVAI